MAWCAFWWARPNFSKQFDPIRKFLDWKQNYIDQDPTKYLSDSYPKNNSFNNMRAPIMKAYIEQIIKSTFSWFKSKWIIDDVPKWFDKKAKVTTLRTARKKKAAAPVEKPTSKFREAKPQQFLLEEFPLTKIE